MGHCSLKIDADFELLRRIIYLGENAEAVTWQILKSQKLLVSRERLALMKGQKKNRYMPREMEHE